MRQRPTDGVVSSPHRVGTIDRMVIICADHSSTASSYRISCGVAPYDSSIVPDLDAEVPRIRPVEGGGASRSVRLLWSIAFGKRGLW